MMKDTFYLQYFIYHLILFVIKYVIQSPDFTVVLYTYYFYYK